jgi:hypothetical protein
MFGFVAGGGRTIALNVTMALAEDPAGTTTSTGASPDTKLLRYHNFQQNNTGTLSLSDDVSISGLPTTITNSAHVTLVGITNGSDSNGGALLSHYYTPSVGSETSAVMNTAQTYTGTGSWMSVRTSYVSKSLADITNYKIQYTGAQNDHPILRTQLVLPAKWVASKVSASGSDSTSLAPGEILIVHTGSNHDNCDSFFPTHHVSAVVSPGDNSIILQNQSYWYFTNSIGIYANATDSNQTISWTQPDVTTCYSAVAEADISLSANVRVMKLTQQGN